MDAQTRKMRRDKEQEVPCYTTLLVSFHCPECGMLHTEQVLPESRQVRCYGDCTVSFEISSATPTTITIQGTQRYRLADGDETREEQS